MGQQVRSIKEKTSRERTLEETFCDIKSWLANFFKKYARIYDESLVPVRFKSNQLSYGLRNFKDVSDIILQTKNTTGTTCSVVRCSYFFSQNCKLCIFWSLLVYRITRYLQNNPSLVLTYNDFSKKQFY